MPSTIGVSAFGGDSLFGLFTKSIGENLSHFPIGPKLTDKFWCALRLRPYALLPASLCITSGGTQARSCCRTH